MLPLDVLLCPGLEVTKRRALAFELLDPCCELLETGIIILLLFQVKILLNHRHLDVEGGVIRVVVVRDQAVLAKGLVCPAVEVQGSINASRAPPKVIEVVTAPDLSQSLVGLLICVHFSLSLFKEYNVIKWLKIPY